MTIKFNNSSIYKKSLLFLQTRRKRIYPTDLILWLGIIFTVFFLVSVPYSASFSQAFIFYGCMDFLFIIFALLWWKKAVVIFFGMFATITSSLLGFYVWLELITHGSFWNSPYGWLFGEHSYARVYITQRAPDFIGSIFGLVSFTLFTWMCWQLIAKFKIKF
jgi:hypothetical protein